MIEHVVQRVLGAVRFIDAAAGFVGAGATPVVVAEPVQVTAAGLTFWRNRRNYYVIARSGHPQLRPHHDRFAAPPAAPPVGSVPFTLEARPAGRGYLPRSAAFSLPRDPNPAAANSLFTPIDVRLYPAPTATVFPGWGALRVTVRRAGGLPAPAALVRVTAADDPANVVGQGLTEWRGLVRGEALVPVADIPTLAVTANGNGLVLSRSIAVVVQAYFDQALDPTAAPPNPDDLEARRADLVASAPVAREIAAGQVLALALSLS